MGFEYRPEDLVRGRRRAVEKSLQDLGPSVSDGVIKILEQWEGKPSEERLTNLIGEEKALICCLMLPRISQLLLYFVS